MVSFFLGRTASSFLKDTGIMVGPIRISRPPPVKSIVSSRLGKQISMTSPRSSPTLRSHRVENLQRGKGKRQKLNAADIAECTNPDQIWYQLAVSKDDDLLLLKIELCKVVKSFIKLDYIHAVYKEKQGKKMLHVLRLFGGNGITATQLKYCVT